MNNHQFSTKDEVKKKKKKVTPGLDWAMLFVEQMVLLTSSSLNIGFENGSLTPHTR